jgi:hypothetical protein
MNSKNNHETNDQSVIIQDLDAQKTEEIKGGPIYVIIRSIDGDVTDQRTTSAGTTAVGGGGGAGKVQMQDFHF